MSLLIQYQALVKQNNLKLDVEQLNAVQVLDTLTKKLINRQSKTNFWRPLTLWFSKPTPIKGLYFHGRVGRGKTMLMDLFYQQVSLKRKKRIHFHHFMESVHQQLHALSGVDDPLVLIAKQWTNDVDLLCFDEFFVNDIGDAMLLSGLLNAMFANGLVLVATSNCRPDQLYKNGLQRERFLPTIALIERYCQIISIDGPVDHRLLSTERVNAGHRDYYVCAERSECGSDFLSQHFLKLAQAKVVHNSSLKILGRDIQFVARSGDVIWFDFMALCSGPRSQRDYIKLADNFRVVLISNVPQFSGALIPAVFSGVEDSYQRSGVVMGELRSLDDEARRFIALVDEFYDRSIRLIVAAEVDISALYQGSQLAHEFARCRSRLFEMQRINYQS